MLDFTKLWDPKYLFGANALDMSRSDLVFFWVALVMVVLAIIFKAIVFRSPKDSPNRFLLNKYFHFLLTMGILMLLWAGARYQNIPWIQTHIVILVLWLISVIWFGFIAKYHWKDYRRHLIEWKEDKTKKKYLP